MQRNWQIIAAYCVVAASSQMLWFTFAPLTSEAAGALHVSVVAVGMLAAIFPLVYAALALASGRLLHQNFQTALSAGAILTCAGAALRLALPDDYTWQIFSQAVISLGQPFVLGALGGLVARHFPKGEQPTAVGIGSGTPFVGILLAMSAGPVLFAAGGLPLVFSVEGVLAVAGAVALIMLLRTTPPAFAAPSAPLPRLWLPTSSQLWRLSALLFFTAGIYAAIAAWLEPILQPLGSGRLAGDLLAFMTLAGIAAAGTLPPIVAARGWRRRALLAAGGWTLLTAMVLNFSLGAVWLGLWLGIEGAVLLASLPVMLEWMETIVQPAAHGASSGFLALAGNLGGFALIAVTAPFAAAPHLALGLWALLACLGLVVAWQMPSIEVVRRSRAVAK